MHLRRHPPRIVLGSYGPAVLGTRCVLGPKEIAFHKRLIGSSGFGKSKLLASYFIQRLNQGLSGALLDPHGDLALDVLGGLIDTGFFRRPDAYTRLMYIDFSRKDAFLPFNVLVQPTDCYTTARAICEAFMRAWPALSQGAAPQFENLLLASLVVLINNDLPITALPRLLTVRTFRDELLNNGKVTDPAVIDFFTNRLERWGRDTPSMLESTLRRVFLLTFTPTLRYSLGQYKNLLNFRWLMDYGVNLIVNLSGLDEASQRFLGCLITVGFETAALSRADTPESLRRPFELVVDEASMFVANSEQALARILSLCRKYGLTITAAHQTLDQFSDRLQSAFQNAVHISFRLGHEDALALAPMFAQFDPMLIKHEIPDPVQAERTHPVFMSAMEQHIQQAQELEQLKPREAYVKIGSRSVKIKTLKCDPVRASQADIRAVTERYAQMLLVPKDALLAPSSGQVTAESEPEPAKPTVSLTVRIDRS